MEHNTDHTLHTHHQMTQQLASNNHSDWNKQRTFRLAISATFHCLIGCGIGEILGVIIGTAFGMDMISTMILAVILGFIGGLLLGILPLLRASFTFKKALKTVIVAEGLSIVVMELFEVLTQIVMPGVMEARLTEPIFWYGMIVALAIGFLAALPINYVMIKKCVRHQH